MTQTKKPPEKIPPPASVATEAPPQTDQPLSTCELPPLRRALPAGVVPATWAEVDPRITRIIRDATAKARWPIVLFGQQGSGKTCAAALTYASWPGENPKWFRGGQLVNLIQTARKEGCVRIPGSENVVGEQSLWRVRVEQPSLLVLDDIGIRDPSESHYEIVYELIDRRVGKPMVVSTNHSPESIAELYDARIESRLSAGTVIDFPLVDRRKQQGTRYRVR